MLKCRFCNFTLWMSRAVAPFAPILHATVPVVSQFILVLIVCGCVWLCAVSDFDS